MEQKADNIFTEGQVLLIDKPITWTSFDVVNKIRRLVRAKKVGHAGTLDPLATGLLILCTGKFTKRISEYMGQEKEYTGTFTLGATTPTFDLESEPQDQKDAGYVRAADLEAASRKFTGEILQVPPIHSAIKKDGQRVYELARMGKEVTLDPRKITIKEFEISVVPPPQAGGTPMVGFRVVCSTGTYIRSLANDVGAALGCGAYLSSLCRTRIGAFSLSDAMDMVQAERYIKEKLGAPPRH
jgi:tRNA pseudouridine55 synthase